MKLRLLIFTLGLIFSFHSPVSAKSKSRARAYSFYDDGGQSHQAGCDPEKKTGRLKKKKEMTKGSGYLGSEVLKSELQPDVEAWKHYYTNQSACESSLKKSASFKTN